MGTKPVFPLLMGMAIPPIISMLIQSLYNVVDSVFVARLSQDALTAVSLAYPLQNLVLAVAVGYGVGANAFIARSLGEGNRQAVDRAAGMGLVFTGLHSLVFLLVGLFGAAPFFTAVQPGRRRAGHERELHPYRDLPGVRQPVPHLH